MRVLHNVLRLNGALPVSLILSITAMSIPVAMAAPGEVNSINNGRDIAGGNYFNTAGSRTTFQNNNGSLWLRSGSLVRGLESSINGTPTGNGGTLYLRAPGNVVRLDGSIDVSAVRNGAAYTGNGGKLFVDSSYLFQNGNVFANGANGGLVQFNVGGFTLGSNARITAQGIGGNGGTVSINSNGTVDIRSGAVIDTSGKVAGTIDTNVINIEGSAINNQGILRANGLATADLKPNNGDSAILAANPQLANNPTPRPITAGSGTGDVTTMRNALFATPGNADFRGGTVRLVASGQTESTTTVINNADSQMLTTADKSALNNRNAQIAQMNEGDVLTRTAINANGALNKNGGTIILSAARHVIVGGTIQANGGSAPSNIFDANGNGAIGGNGGTITLATLGNISNTGTIQANGGTGSMAQSRLLTTGNGANASVSITGVGGTGGQGGVIAFSSNASANSGSMQVIGGRGGTGGNATALDSETVSSGNPVANAAAVAGRGGVGGRGGLFVFSGNSNPTGGGSVQANGGQGGNGGTARAEATASTNNGTPTANASGTGGPGGVGGTAGTIVAINPATFASSQNTSARAGGTGATGAVNLRRTLIRNGMSTVSTSNTALTGGSIITGNNNPILATRRNEYIRHDDAALLLTQANGAGAASTNLTGRFGNAVIRTVNAPGGTAINTLDNALSSSSLVIASSAASLALNADIVNSNIDPRFFNLNNLTVVNNGNFTNGTLWTPGVHIVGAGFHDLELAYGGGHISWLANGSITNNSIVITRGLWSGGAINVAANQNVVNNNDFITIADNKALLSGFTVAGPPFESSHAGSLTIKARTDISNTNNGKMESNLIFFDIHPPLNQNPPIAWPRFLNGAQIGASINLLAGRNLSNTGQIRADALTYRNGPVGLQNPALTIGGIIIGRSRTGTFTNSGSVTALGNAFFSPNASDGPRFNVNNFPAATSFNGNIDMN